MGAWLAARDEVLLRLSGPSEITSSSWPRCLSEELVFDVWHPEVGSFLPTLQGCGSGESGGPEWRRSRLSMRSV